MAVLFVYRQIKSKCRCCVPNFEKLVFKYGECNNNVLYIYNHNNGSNYKFVGGHEPKRLMN